MFLLIINLNNSIVSILTRSETTLYINL